MSKIELRVGGRKCARFVCEVALSFWRVNNSCSCWQKKINENIFYLLEIKVNKFELESIKIKTGIYTFTNSRNFMFAVNNVSATLTPEGVLKALQNDPYFSSKNRKIIENTLVFITILTLHTYYHKKLWENDPNERNPYQGISSELLTRIFTRDMYNEILERLVALGIVEINHSYLVANFTKSYRLTETYYNQPFVARRIQYSTVKTKTNKLREHVIHRKLEKYPYLIQQFRNLQLVHINEIEATKFIEANKDQVNEFGEAVIEDSENYLMQIQKVHYVAMCNFAVSESNDRLHSLITSFPRKLRPFLGLVVESTGEIITKKCAIDQANTQPLLLALTMENENITPDADFKRFCMNGTLYDVMANELQESRRWVKEYMMSAILYTPSNSEYTHSRKNLNEVNSAKKKISLYFKKRFPLVYNYLKNKKEELKQSDIVSKNIHNKGGSLLACEIQALEAKFWIHTLLAEIPNDIIYVTIHDSIVLFNPTESQIDTVVGIIKEQSWKMFGFEIPLKLEYDE